MSILIINRENIILKKKDNTQIVIRPEDRNRALAVIHGKHFFK
jgi:hypothetical protein